MSKSSQTSSSRSNTDGRAHYKITKTVTGPDGTTRTETVEVVDDEAIKLMQRVGLHDDHSANTDHHGVRALINSSHPSQSSRPTPPKRAVVAQDNSEFVREALQLHNELRRKHGVEQLRLNNDLSKLAQQWADHLASTGSLVHSKTKYRNANLGENLYAQSWPMTGKEMTESWYNECQKYDFENRRSYQSGTGHFTQIVWKGSQEVGFAQAQGASMNFAVAMYYPAGNFLGEFEKNVLPPRSS